MEEKIRIKKKQPAVEQTKSADNAKKEVLFFNLLMKNNISMRGKVKMDIWIFFNNLLPLGFIWNTATKKKVLGRPQAKSQTKIFNEENRKHDNVIAVLFFFFVAVRKEAKKKI